MQGSNTKNQTDVELRKKTTREADVVRNNYYEKQLQQ